MACHSLGIPPTGHAKAPSGSVHARALAACPQGPRCLRPGACQGAHASMPRPWLLHACLGLGSCMPMGCCLGLGCCMPWPWLPAHGGCLGLGCCMPWPWQDAHGGLLGRSGHPRGMPACTPRRIAPHRPALRQNWLVPFSIFVSLNSFHDFRGGFQQAVRRSERFLIFYDFSYFSASKNHKK